jgi:hypothetical protein
MDNVEKFEVDGLTVRILYDEDGPNPRKDCDQAGHMICFHRNYNLGDDHHYSIEGAKKLADRIIAQGDGVVLPLYLYDHSGITMSTSAFSCPWDSGQVGFIYMTKDDIRKNWGVKHVTKKLLQQATDLLISEVKEYDFHLTGQCYGFIVEAPDGEELDSCWGFLGKIEYVIGEATSAAKGEAKAYFAKKREAEMEYGAQHNA